MRILDTLVTASFMLSILVPSAEGLQFNIDRETEMRLGDGIDPLTGQIFNACVTFDVNNMYRDHLESSEAPSSVSDARLELTQIKSARELDRYTNLTISGSFNYYGSGGKFSYNNESQYTLFSDQASLGVSQEADYGRFYLKYVRLTDEMALLAKENPKEFEKRCGKEYIAGAVQGQGIRVLLSTEMNSIYTYERIQASLKASYNGGVTKASLSSSFENIASELIKNGMLKINVFTYGSGPMNATQSLVRKQEDIEAYRTQIADIIQGMTPEDAVFIRYISRPYPGVITEYNPIFVAHQRETFDDLFAIYRRLADTRRRLAGIMGVDFESFAQRECILNYHAYCVEYVAMLEDIAEHIEQAIVLVDALATKCADADDVSECRLPTLTEVNVDVLTRVQWPQQFRFALYLQMLKDMRDGKLDVN